MIMCSREHCPLKEVVWCIQIYKNANTNDFYVRFENYEAGLQNLCSKCNKKICGMHNEYCDMESIIIV